MRYFIVTYIKRPNGATDELTALARRLRTQDVDCASVILDFQQCAVVKASLGDKSAPRDWTRIRDFYHQHYKDIIDQLEARHHAA